MIDNYRLQKYCTSASNILINFGFFKQFGLVGIVFFKYIIVTQHVSVTLNLKLE